MDSSIITRGPYPSPVMQKAMEEIKSFIDALQASTNDTRSILRGNYIVTMPGLAIGSTAPNASNIEFTYGIGGKVYRRAALAAGTALSGDNIPQALFGAWRLEIVADGTISIVAAAANATGYASAVLAAAGLPAIAASKVAMGVVTASLSSGVFNPGTTDLDAANTTVAYTDAATMFETLGAAVS